MTRRRHPLFCQGAAALSTKGSTSPVADGLRILTLALAAALKLNLRPYLCGETIGVDCIPRV